MKAISAFFLSGRLTAGAKIYESKSGIVARFSLAHILGPRIPAPHPHLPPLLRMAPQFFAFYPQNQAFLRMATGALFCIATTSRKNP